MLLKASERALQFKATDLEREVSDEAPADVSQPGAVTVPAHILHDIVRKLPDGAQVEIKRDAEKERLTLRSGHSRFQLQTLAPEDFPDLAAGELGHKFEIAANDLKRLIDKTRFAISTEETRYYLNGIYLHAATRGKEQTLRAVATDGHRLAQAELAAAQGRRRHAGHHPAAQDRARAASADRGQRRHRRVGVSPAKARFEIGTITLTSKLIDGTFPDYGRVIPKANDKALKVSNAEFMSAVDRVSTIASERGRAVKLNISGDKLMLSVNNPEGGSATEEISAEYDCRRRSRSASTPTICSTSPASSRATRRSSSWPTRARPPWSRTTATKARSTCSCRCVSDAVTEASRERDGHRPSSHAGPR